jgi:hypothetical protein
MRTTKLDISDLAILHAEKEDVVLSSADRLWT